MFVVSTIALVERAPESEKCATRQRAIFIDFSGEGLNQRRAQGDVIGHRCIGWQKRQCKVQNTQQEDLTGSIAIHTGKCTTKHQGLTKRSENG